MFKVPTLGNNKKEKDKTKKWKGFSVSLKRFELDDVSDLKIIDKWCKVNNTNMTSRRNIRNLSLAYPNIW